MDVKTTARFCPECETRTDSDQCPKCGSRTLRVRREEPENDPLLGQTLEGRYRIDALIGRGGMGAVYKAVQLATGQVVAVKVVRSEHARDVDAARRFHREVRAASLLSHPNTIRVFDFGESEDGDLFMVLEFLSGRTLGHLIRQTSALPESRVAKIGCEVARSLSEAHAAGLAHRDLKPDNVMLVNAAGDSDFVKVLDFGIAKFLSGDSGQSSMTGTGLIIGTPQYMAPEQASGVRTPTPAVDVYALGVVLYEALSGTRPFCGDSPMIVMMAHIRNPVPALPAHLPVSADMRALLDAMLAKDPQARPVATVVAGRLERLRLQALLAGTGPVEAAGPDHGALPASGTFPVRGPNGTMLTSSTGERPASSVDFVSTVGVARSEPAMLAIGASSGPDDLTATTPVPEPDDLIGWRALVSVAPGETTPAMSMPDPPVARRSAAGTPSRPLVPQNGLSSSDRRTTAPLEPRLGKQPTQRRRLGLVSAAIVAILLVGGVVWNLAGRVHRGEADPPTTVRVEQVPNLGVVATALDRADHGPGASGVDADGVVNAPSADSVARSNRGTGTDVRSTDIASSGNAGSSERQQQVAVPEDPMPAKKPVARPARKPTPKAAPARSSQREDGGGGSDAASNSNLPAQLSMAQVAGEMRKKQTAIDTCVRKAGIATPCRISSRVVIDGSGKVVSAMAPGSGGAESCVEGVLRSIRFPAFKGDDMTVPFPFTVR